MPEDVIAGRYNGVMADHEVERFRIWDEMGDEMVVSKLSIQVREAADWFLRSLRSGAAKQLPSWHLGCSKEVEAEKHCITTNMSPRRLLEHRDQFASCQK